MNNDTQQDLLAQERLNFYKPDQSKDKLLDNFINFSEKIRKDKRVSLIARKRLMGAPIQDNQDDNSIIKNENIPTEDKYILDLLNKLINPYQGKDQLKSMRELRITLTNIENQETIAKFIQKGGIDLLTGYLSDQNSNEQIKEEAIWSLTNLSVVSSYYESEFVKVVNALMNIIRNDNVTNLQALLILKQHCLQALGNYAIDSQVLRQQIMGNDGSGLKVIIDLLFFNRPQLSEQCIFTINNFILGDKSLVPLCIEFDLCRGILHIFDKIVKKPDGLMTETFWCLSYILDYNSECASKVLQSIPDLNKKIVNELDPKIITPINRPAIRILGNLTSLQPEIGQILIYDDKFQDFILTVLFNQESNILKKECLWVLSNILGGPSEHNFDIILDNKNLLDQICNLALCQDYQVKKEALVALYNLCENHNNRYLNKVMQKNPSFAFFNVLLNYQNCDPYLLLIAISYCSLICEKFGDTALQSMQQADVIEMIENIQYKYSENQELVKMSQSFLDTFYHKTANNNMYEIDQQQNMNDNQERMDFRI